LQFKRLYQPCISSYKLFFGVATRQQGRKKIF
jgi:hypothetical protein